MKVKPNTLESYLALGEIVSILNDLDILYFIDGGTLLGFYRDGDFCEDDHDDIDISVMSVNWRHHEEIDRRMKDAGFELYRAWMRDETNHRSGQYAWKRHGIKVDLMYKEVKLDKVWWTVYGGKNKVTYKAVPFQYISVVKDLGHGLLMPMDTEGYLNYRYGDWRTPIHRDNYSCYTSDLSIIKENKYEAI